MPRPELSHITTKSARRGVRVGRRSTIGNRVYVKSVPRVRISSSPPLKEFSRFKALIFSVTGWRYKRFEFRASYLFKARREAAAQRRPARRERTKNASFPRNVRPYGLKHNALQPERTLKLPASICGKAAPDFSSISCAEGPPSMSQEGAFSLSQARFFCQSKGNTCLRAC